MEEKLILIGFLLIFVGIILLFFGSLLSAFKTKQTKVEWGFGGFIGFLPFGYWSSKRMMYVVIACLLIISLLLLLFTRKFP